MTGYILGIALSRNYLQQWEKQPRLYVTGMPGGGSPGAGLPRIAPRVPIAPFALADGYVPRFEPFFSILIGN
jgi:hypothetical protein